MRLRAIGSLSSHASRAHSPASRLPRFHRYAALSHRLRPGGASGALSGTRRRRVLFPILGLCKCEREYTTRVKAKQRSALYTLSIMNVSTMKVPVRGIELYGERTGAGPPCILLHGGPGMSHPGMLERFAPLADLVELIYYDQRGHGKSTRAPAATYTIGDQAEDLHACQTLTARRGTRRVHGGGPAVPERAAALAAACPDAAIDGPSNGRSPAADRPTRSSSGRPPLQRSLDRPPRCRGCRRLRG